MRVAALTAICCYVEAYTYTLWQSLLHARSRCITLESEQCRLDLFAQMNLYTDPMALSKGPDHCLGERIMTSRLQFAESLSQFENHQMKKIPFKRLASQ